MCRVRQTLVANDYSAGLRHTEIASCTEFGNPEYAGILSNSPVPCCSIRLTRSRQFSEDELCDCESLIWQCIVEFSISSPN